MLMLRIIYTFIFLDACIKCLSHPSAQELLSRRSIQRESAVPPTPTSSTQSTSNQPAGRGALPAAAAPGLQWHAAIYNKSAAYAHVCGGSVVTRDVVITAANCFWDEVIDALSSASFAVAAGKLLEPWDAKEPYAQKSDIASIHVPALFSGARAHYAHDIAAARLRTALRYSPAVQPLCVSFDPRLDRSDQWRDIDGELQPLHMRVSGWGMDFGYGASKTRLASVEVPIHKGGTCANWFNPNYSEYFSSDKICGGFIATVIAFCQSESGGGLVHFSYLGNSSTNVPYLYAVGSTLRGAKELCNDPPTTIFPASFTHVLHHKEFLKELVPDLEDECRVYLDTEQSNDGQSGESGRSDQSGRVEGKLNVTKPIEVSSLPSDPTQASPATPLPAGPNVQAVAPSPSPEGVSVAVRNGTLKITVTSVHTVTIELPQKIFTP